MAGSCQHSSRSSRASAFQGDRPLKPVCRRADSLDMDASGRFTSVLNPGEHLVWSYQVRVKRSGAIAGFTIVASTLWAGSFMFLRDASRAYARTLWLRAELIGVAGYFLLLPVFVLWLKLRWARKTAYALTDRRVLMAVGPRREDIREVALTALGRVMIVNGHELLLTPRLPLRSFFKPPSVWTFPDTGKPDQWASPYWRVPDSASVQELLENARNAIWYLPNPAAAPPSDPPALPGALESPRPRES
jgi:hypothetical protein